MPSGIDIGALSGRIELEDNFSPGTALVLKRLDDLEGKFTSVGQQAAASAAGFFTAEAALHAVEAGAELLLDTLSDLTLGGSAAASVQENFARLTEQAGLLGTTLLTTLREGTHGTVEDLTLIKLVNQDLAAGMKLTEDQFKTLTEGAFALAQATGTDVADALEIMNDALLKGQTRSVAALTGKIDLTAAEEAYAKSLGTTADRLTAEEKLEADRLAILKSVTEATERLGEQTDGIGEMVAQAQVFWANFMDELGVAIATSPVIVTGFKEIQSAILDAFGGSKEEMVKTITNAINEGAIAALSFAQTVVDGIGLAGMTWNSFQIILEESVNGFRAITFVAEEVLLALMEIANFASGGLAFNEWIAATKEDLDRLYNEMALGTARIAEHRAEQDAWATSTGALNEKIAEIQAKMVAANKATEEATEVGAALTTTNEEGTVAAGELADATERVGNAARLTKEEQRKLDEATAEIAQAMLGLKAIYESIDPTIVTTAKFLMDQGVSLEDIALKYRLTEIEVRSINESWKEQHKLLDENKKKADKVADAWENLNSIGHDWMQTLAGVGDRVISDIQHYMEMGASLSDLKLAYGLTDAQLRAIKETLGELDNAWEGEKENLDEVGQKAEKTTSKYDKLKEATNMEMGGSFEVNRGNLAATANFWKIPEAVAFEAAKRGFSWQEIVQAFQSDMLDEWIPHGPRISGFREGGIGDFGDGTLAVLHGKEAIVPLDQYNMGNTTLVFNVNGTAEESARKIKDIITRELKSARQFGAA